jgi:hypothetical protein
MYMYTVVVSFASRCFLSVLSYSLGLFIFVRRVLSWDGYRPSSRRCEYLQNFEAEFDGAERARDPGNDPGQDRQPLYPVI